MDSRETQNDMANPRMPIATEKWRKSTVNNRRQTEPISSPSESIQKEIKQIIPLDLKKLKDLGIESNILTALNKFNAKERAIPFSATKPGSGGVASTSKQVNRIPTPTQSQRLHTPIIQSASPAQSIQLHKPSSCTDTSANKVQILSDIRLANNELLFTKKKIQSATSLTSNIDSHVIEAPTNAPDKNGDISNESSISDEMEEFYGFNTSDYIVLGEEAMHLDAVSRRDALDEKRVAPSLCKQNPSLFIAHNQYEFNGDICKSVLSTENKSHSEAEESTDLLEHLGSASGKAIDAVNESDENVNESDLEDLIEQARFTMEHANRLETPPIVYSETDSFSQDSIDSASEASDIDNDRFIENFLELTKNSFRIENVDDSDDSDENEAPDDIHETNENSIQSSEEVIPLPMEVYEKHDETLTPNEVEYEHDHKTSPRQINNSPDINDSPAVISRNIENSELPPIAETIELSSSKGIQMNSH